MTRAKRRRSDQRVADRRVRRRRRRGRFTSEVYRQLAGRRLALCSHPVMPTRRGVVSSAFAVLD